MRKLSIYFILIIVISSCNYSKEDLIGTYVKTPSINTIDTLFLYKDNRYKQKIYFKTGELFGLNENKWSINEKRIDFIDFYLNYDFDLNDYSKPKGNRFNKTSLISSLLPLRKDKIIIDEDQKIYYIKIEN